MNVSDEIIMHKVKEGDVDRLALLFERYHMELYNFFLKTSSDPHLSSDLTQIVFYRILKYKKSYDQNKRFRTWMYMIARNSRIDAYKKNKTNILGDDFILSKADRNEDLPYDNEESINQVQKALSRLSHEKRELITMSFYLNMPSKDIALVLKITENNARVRLHRAIGDLREIYNKL
ncbi:sigma-70 family RNA polymerase sigma factor [Winogradskyella sp.]|uniref:RNA polymerase sigma factor n=1 Tax=Winogradskyella sp. TaxID=1883156 RepID=UPI0026016022|nr:sigma-70 family RNA polymerase sigma factor [Winogradskyella sp.]